MTEEVHFYYDESEHSRKINHSTITAENYYDNFVTVIVGWDKTDEKSIEEKYLAFETKYADRKSKGELKSETIKPKQFKNGFASLNKDNIRLISDLLDLYNTNIYVYFSVASKTEFIVHQLFKNYKSNIFVDMEAMKYSIIKAIVVYQPQDIICGLYENTQELVVLLRNFFEERIVANQENPDLKHLESNAFEQILILLDDINEQFDIDWNYNMAFWGFKKYLSEKGIINYTLLLDKEGKDDENSNTLCAAIGVGLSNVSEANSKNHFGLRMADMLAGIITKLSKNLHTALIYESPEAALKKKLLGDEWFNISEQQLELYRKLKFVIIQLNISWYKSYAGVYSDDLIVFIALLNYMSNFNSIAEFHKKSSNLHAEHFNALCCENLSDYYKRMQSKLDVEPIANSQGDYFYNQRGAKVFFDSSKQPLLKFKSKNQTFNVLSVGFTKEMIPLITVQTDKEPLCLRLPPSLSEWAVTCVGMVNSGMSFFPTQVMFSRVGNDYFADIL